ncbi:MAG: hypothetical protein ACE5WD_12320 [Candidatus Aminicenantia bacterium]
MRSHKEQYIVDATGKKHSVVIPVEEYEELLEDLHDLAIVAERRNEPNISWEEVKKKLKRDGLIQS